MSRVPVNRKQYIVRLTCSNSCDIPAHSKVWDTYSGEALHTFQHAHIVRTVALSPQVTPQYLLTVRPS